MDFHNEATFVAPEGVYSLIDEVKAPTFAPGGSVSTSAVASQHPTHLSTIAVHYPTHGQKQNPPMFGTLLAAAKERTKDREKDRDDTKREPDKTSLSSGDRTEEGPHSNTTTPPDQSLIDHRDVPPTPISPLTPTSPLGVHPFANNSPISRPKTASKPKHNMRTTSSSFVTRVHSLEGLSRHLSSKQGDVTYVFYNSARSLFWIEHGAKSKDPLCRVTFSSFPTCHAVNSHTASPERLDIIIGFSTGDLVWFEPISCRYTRLNKGGAITNSHVTSVKWIPGNDRIFVSSHLDGTMIVFDKEREDPTPNAFLPRQPILPSSPMTFSTPSPVRDSNPMIYNRPLVSGSNSSNPPPIWNPLFDILVSTPSWYNAQNMLALLADQKDTSQSPLRDKREKVGKNPITHWRVSRRAVSDFVFSPDTRHIACISEDGCLRIIDALMEQLIDCYASYFGPFTSVAWSPDGRYILTGGQDDLVTIYSPWEQRRVIARCQGHSSFITCTTFDESRCDGQTYRFGSVGEDCRLILASGFRALLGLAYKFLSGTSRLLFLIVQKMHMAVRIRSPLTAHNLIATRYLQAWYIGVTMESKITHLFICLC